MCTIFSHSILDPTCRAIITLLYPHPPGITSFTCTGDVSAQGSSAQTPVNEQVSLEEKHIFRNLPIDDHSNMKSVEEIDGKLMRLIMYLLFHELLLQIEVTTAIT